MDWCCARHHSQWLTQQGSSHNRGTYSRPGFLYISHLPLFLPSPSLSILIFPICCCLFVLPSGPLCLLSFFVFASCFFLRYLNVTEVKGPRLQSSLSPSLFLIVIWARRWASCCGQNYCNMQSSLLPLWGISILEQAKCERRQVLHSSAGQHPMAAWYRHTNIHREGHQLALFCRLTVHLLLVGTHCHTLLWQTSSILNRILWCVYETTIFLWYE